MASKTYAKRVNIIKYVKAANGWRFAPAVKRPNGSIHWDQVLIGGTPRLIPKANTSLSGVRMESADGGCSSLRRATQQTACAVMTDERLP